MLTRLAFVGQAVSLSAPHFSAVCLSSQCLSLPRNTGHHSRLGQRRGRKACANGVWKATRFARLRGSRSATGFLSRLKPWPTKQMQQPLPPVCAPPISGTGCQPVCTAPSVRCAFRSSASHFRRILPSTAGRAKGGAEVRGRKACANGVEPRRDSRNVEEVAPRPGFLSRLKP
jgi:hypothetical protein